MSELDQLLKRRPGERVRPEDFATLVRYVARLYDEFGRDLSGTRATLTDTVQFVNVLQERLLIVDDLPAEAPLGALIRRRNGTVAERATVYTGNGPGQPLARLVPQPL